jgi:hypothetical protein
MVVSIAEKMMRIMSRKDHDEFIGRGVAACHSKLVNDAEISVGMCSETLYANQHYVISEPTVTKVK